MKQRKTCVLYVTATCNLKCKYCYIYKSPILIEIDKMLQDSYKDDYYFNFMIKMFDKYSLENLEFWGGEPSYGLERAIPTVYKALNYYPNLNRFFFSTNLATEKCIEDIFNFWSIAKKFPEREFTFSIQLSLDGPLPINDFNRGEGVTKIFTKNFSKLLIKAKEFLDQTPNVKIDAHFKPTLDNYAIELLQTKESIINYYKFFENYYQASENVLALQHRWSLNPSLPNTATPSPHTTENGKQFANFCKLVNDIIMYDDANKYFKFYKNIMPFNAWAENEFYCLDHGCGTCGTGNIILGLLPNNMISGCHNGFVELISDYKNNITLQPGIQVDKSLFEFNSSQNNLIFTEEEYKNFEKQMKYYCPESKFQIIEMSAVIHQMAQLKQIDEKYLDKKKAVEAAHFIQNVTSSCMRDNLGTSGTKYLYQLGYLRLFLNGAKEEIQKNARYFLETK